MKRRRVVITGIGAVTPIGSGLDGLWSGVVAGKSAVTPITRFDASPFRSQVAAEVNDFDPLDYMDPRVARKLDRFAQFGIATAIQAMHDARFDAASVDSDRFGVSLGSALGGVAYGEEQHEAFLRDGLKAVGPMLAVAVYGGASGANIAIYLNLNGPNLTNSNSCASGTIAIGEAMRVIQHNEADVMIAGGVEAPLAPLTFGAFSLIKAMSTRNHEPHKASRPFDRDRDGFVMAEGASLLMLEERSLARRRGAKIYAELMGFGQTNDAYHMTAPRPDGSQAGRAVSLALMEARLPGSGVDYVNAHATGTALGDVAEGCALHRALGLAAHSVPVSGTKGLYGHALGASGAIEASISALALSRGFLPGTTNLDEPDQACELNLLRSGQVASPEYALSTSFGFGGANSALLLRRHDGAERREVWATPSNVATRTPTSAPPKKVERSASIFMR